MRQPTTRKARLGDLAVKNAGNLSAALGITGCWTYTPLCEQNSAPRYVSERCSIKIAVGKLRFYRCLSLRSATQRVTDTLSLHAAVEHLSTYALVAL
jgi:hypothetical protein